jgi:hypothetical protein
MHSRKPHERMIANAQSIEVLLHVSFGRGFKWLSVPIDDANYAESVQIGEKMCVAAMKCFIVSRRINLDTVSNVSGLGILRSSRVSRRSRKTAVPPFCERFSFDVLRVSCRRYHGVHRRCTGELPEIFRVKAPRHALVRDCRSMGNGNPQEL